MGYVFVTQGTADGVAMVDVVTTGSDPIEYGIPLADAIAAYGDRRRVNDPSEV